jgi:hypothetical protein
LWLFIAIVWRDFQTEYQQLLSRIYKDLEVLQHQTTFAFRHDLMSHTCIQREDSFTIIKDIDELKGRAKEEDLRRFLEPASFEASYMRQLDKRDEGSGTWLLNAPAFRAWLVSPADLLWIHGGPGCGKSVLSSVVIEYLQSNVRQNERVAYHYFDFADPQNNTALRAFSTLLYQLRNVSGESLRTVNHVVQGAQVSGRKTISQAESARSLKCIAGSQDCHVAIVLDGLDESDEGFAIATFLVGLVQTSPNLRVLVLSRKIPELSKAFANQKTMTIDKTSTKPDIDALVERNIRFMGIESSVRSTGQIIAEVQGQADGSFSWASMMTEKLKNAVSPADVEELLQSCSGIDKLCRKSLLQLTKRPHRQQEIARRAIYWICCARTPLTIMQLQSATAFSPEVSRFELAQKPFVSVLENLTSTLFEIDTRHLLVRPLHASVKGFLTSAGNRFSEENPAVSSFLVDLASRNLDVALESLALAKTFLDRERHLSSLDEEPLFHYCAIFWLDHLLASPPSEGAAEVVISFLQTDCRRRWITYYLVKQRRVFPLYQLLRFRTQLCTWLRATKRYDHGIRLKWDHDIASALIELYGTKQSLCNNNVDSRSDLQPDKEEGVSHFEKMMIVRDLARYLTQNKTLSEGIDLFESVLAANSIAGRSIEYDDVWIMNTLGILYDQAGQVELATTTQEGALDVLSVIPEPNSAISDQMIWTSNELGRMYRHQTRYALAESMHLEALQALETSQACMMGEHRVILEIAWTKSTLARVYRAQRNHCLALKYSSAAHKTRLELLGRKHPHTLWVLSDIAQIHLEQHDSAKAVDLHTEILAGRKESLGDEHADTLWTMNNLGVALAMLGTEEALKQAREMQIKALQGQERVLGPEHPHVEWTRKRVTACC